MLVIEKPTPGELAHMGELAVGGVAIVEQRQPFAEVAPIEAADGQYWAKYELYGDPYAVIYFLSGGSLSDA